MTSLHLSSEDFDACITQTIYKSVNASKSGSDTDAIVNDIIAMDERNECKPNFNLHCDLYSDISDPESKEQTGGILTVMFFYQSIIPCLSQMQRERKLYSHDLPSKQRLNQSGQLVYSTDR